MELWQKAWYWNIFSFRWEFVCLEFGNTNDLRYEGEWKEDKEHGKGIARYASGNKYEGAWADGKINGYGVLTYFDGDRVIELIDNE